MKKIIFLSFVLVGCSHTPKPESVVHFPYAAELLEKIQQTTSRAPASVALDANEEKSARRTYFSTLFHQYLTLGSYYGKGSEIKSCPQFHHDKVEVEAVRVSKISLYRPAKMAEEGKPYFPELAFKGNHTLKEYYTSIKGELETLCEEGLSDNFYKFDNLITHYAHKKSFHLNHKAMESVLKIPVFANFYLIKMMSAHSGVELTYPEETRFIEMTQTHWFKQYVSEASALRTNYIKNKIVQR